MNNELDIINACLDALGEDQIASIATGHPELSNIQNIIERERKRLLSRGWYFNKQERTFFPDNSGKILLPKTILSFEPKDEQVGVFSDLGGTLYDNKNDTNIFDEQVELIVILDYPELNIPYLALDYLSLLCQSRVMHRADITGGPLQDIQIELDMAGRKLLEADLRSKDLNMNNTPMRRQLGNRAVPYAPIYKRRRNRR